MCPPLVEIGLTDLPKSGANPLATGLKTDRSRLLLQTFLGNLTCTNKQTMFLNFTHSAVQHKQTIRPCVALHTGQGAVCIVGTHAKPAMRELCYAAAKNTLFLVRTLNFKRRQEEKLLTIHVLCIHFNIYAIVSLWGTSINDVVSSGVSWDGNGDTPKDKLAY